MSAAEYQGDAIERPLPAWLRDQDHPEATNDFLLAEGSTKKGGSKDDSKDISNRDTSEVLSLILTELQRQSLRINDVKATLSRNVMYRTCFDVLTMTNVTLDAVCESPVSHLRSTVKYTGLTSTVTISFTSGEVSIFLDDPTDDVDFTGVNFTSDCILNCQLFAGMKSCSVVLNIDTQKITDLTQLTLIARSEEATKELYQALMALCGRDTMNPGAHLHTPPSFPRPRLASAAVSAVTSELSSQLLAQSPKECRVNSRGGMDVMRTPTMRRCKESKRSSLSEHVP
ncbi:hypothetical protein MOQ_007764 [Trypanosoma cruzi marinkellei]|uniref:Uncharacterized protein n=1 Tax=Trypanosoma cruzi marinkellei TaxID=85056 RepID=K2N1S3_TRYCR|nr:hypothetical protein MOQ_007764 [Trypanosoma cruzi marinkellei]